MIRLECPQCGAAAPAPPERVCGYCRYVFPVAPGAHAPDGFGINWLLDRVREHLSATPAVQIAPSIDERSRTEALRTYARGALPDEPIVALYDAHATPDGVGWALSQRAFYFSAAPTARAIPWRALEPSMVAHQHPSLTVAGASVCADDVDVARALAGLLRVLALSADGLPEAPKAPPKFTDESLLASLRAKIPGAKSLHYWPDVPPEKEQAAREVYGADLHPAERVLALYDTTWLGGGDEGWLLTARRLYTNDAWEGRAFVELANIVHEGVFVGSKGVVVQMKATACCPDEMRAPLAEFFRGLAKY